MDEAVEAALTEAGARINALAANERRLIDELAKVRKDADRYRWLRDLLAAEDVARLVDEHAQWSWCGTDPAESAKTDAAVDKAMAASKAVGAA